MSLLNHAHLPVEPPPEVPFPGRYNPAGHASSATMELLGYLAWGATAAGVAGILIVGMQLALQLRRSEPGEGATYFRGLVYVLLACVLASTAGPIVEFLGPLGLQ